MNFKAVIFDLDGTLLDTLEDLAEAVNYGLANLGFPEHRREEFKYFIGAGREVLAALSLPEGQRDPDMIKQLCEFVDDYYERHWTDHTRPYPGVPELLDSLTARGLPMAILSNKPQHFTEINVAQLLARWHFAAVIGAAPGQAKKPECTEALKIAGRIGLAPADFVYVGDSDIDMQTALNACMYPAAATWGFRTAAELKQAGARVLLKKPTDLLELLDGLHETV